MTIGKDGLDQPQRDQLRQAYSRFIRILKPQYAMTFNFGPWIRPGFGHYAMKGFGCMIERKVLGRKYYNLHNGRLTILGFFEHADTNPHWHCVVRAPGNLPHFLQEHGVAIWEKLVPDGQLDFGPIRNLHNVRSYFTKETWKDTRLDQVFIYSRNPRKKFGQC